MPELDLFFVSEYDPSEPPKEHLHVVCSCAVTPGVAEKVLVDAGSASRCEFGGEGYHSLCRISSRRLS